MSINIRTKGQTGEREVATALNAIVRQVLLDNGYPLPAKDVVQRNQNQSAVGGSDLVGTFGLSIEVKRQEALAINTWWNQTVAGAKQAQGRPVLVYRQNGKKWLVVMNAMLPLPIHLDDHELLVGAFEVRCEMSWESFLSWFKQWVDRKVKNEGAPKI